jgi:hypothetical protein
METLGAEIFTLPTIFGAGAGTFGVVVDDEVEDELEEFVGDAPDCEGSVFTVTGMCTKAVLSQLSHS